MTQYSEVPTRVPASDILRQAARLDLELQPGTLPSSGRYLFEAIDDGLIPLRRAKVPGRRIALDTAATLCAEHAGKRVAPIMPPWPAATVSPRGAFARSSVPLGQRLKSG